MPVRRAIVSFFLAAFVSATAGAAGKGVAAGIQVGKHKQRQNVVLLGRRKGLVMLRHANAAGEASTGVVALDPKTIKKVRIRLEYDQKSYAKAKRKKNWAMAGALLAKALAPALPFMDLKNNNLLAPALRAATYFMRAGAAKTNGSREPEARQAGEREYRLANALCQRVMQAEWSPRADRAALMSCICLTALGRLDEAEALLAEQSEPDSGDDDYGLYRLAQGGLLAARGKPLEAIEAAVQGIAFETKDIDTFPDTLMLSAYCYEKLGDWYRARDVYYEVARLFGKTHWAAAARARLEFIMSREYTKKDESVAAANVFFGIEEDVNAEVQALLHPENAKKDAPAHKTTPKETKSAPHRKAETGKEGE